ncbi:MAG: EamA/RhaT family transporter [Flavobacteriales bacterium]|nr:EamA/RhaT family transporter [Flavobacteriales bacterium]
MIPLALSILSSSVLLVIFKYFQKFGVNTFQAITVNYVVAASLGYMMTPEHFSMAELTHKPWALSAVLIGSVFIGMFYIMALSSQKVGIAVSSVANKMSLVIPVVAGFILYNETMGALKITGIVLAVIAVVMVTFTKTKLEVESKYLVLPFIIFLGSGFLDTIFKYVQTTQLATGEIEIFSASLFLMSAIVGSSILIAKRVFKGSVLETKSIIAGFALGVPNYFSIHFLLNALNLPNLESTVVFPINNTGIVLLSTLLAILLFHEKLSKLNWAGVALAVASISLIAIV